MREKLQDYYLAQQPGQIMSCLLTENMLRGYSRVNCVSKDNQCKITTDLTGINAILVESSERDLIASVHV